MSERTRRRVGSEFSAWAADHHPDVDVEADVVETILDYKESYLGSAEPASWRPGEMTEILTEIIPRKVVADQDWNGALVRTAPLFVEFLADQKQLRQARRLRSEVESALPEFLAAANDPSNFGMGKRLLAGMGVDHIAGQAELDSLMAQFNALPFEERDRIIGGLPPAGPPPGPAASLPTVRLAPITDLIGAARQSPLVADILSLARWLGERREITGAGLLRVKDGKQAAVELGLVTREELAHRERQWKIRSSAELRELDELWRTAATSGFVRLSRTRAYPGAALAEWESGDDEAVLSAWADVFDAALAGLVEGDAAIFPYQADIHADLPSTLFTAYVDDGISRAQVVERLLDDLANDPVLRLHGADPATRVRDAFDKGLSRLERLRAVSADGDVVNLTPLAVWRLNAMYASFGWDAPSVGDLRDADTMTRLEGVARLTDDDAEAELVAWLDGADHAKLADELVEAVGEVELSIRPLVFDLLMRIGQPAAPALARLLDTRWWRYAAAWYEVRGEPGPRPLSGPDRAWMLVEQIAPMIDAAGDDVDIPGAVIPAESADVSSRMFDDLSRSGHPRAGDVLEMLSRIAPDKASSKAARKAAFKARSRPVV